jgi:hypothetical protein
LFRSDSRQKKKHNARNNNGNVKNELEKMQKKHDDKWRSELEEMQKKHDDK